MATTASEDALILLNGVSYTVSVPSKTASVIKTIYILLAITKINALNHSYCSRPFTNI